MAESDIENTNDSNAIGVVVQCRCSAWTDQKPETAGYYWYRDESGTRIVLVRAPWHQLPETYIAYWPTKGMEAENANVQIMHGEWHGPLTEPNDQSLATAGAGLPKP